MAGTYLLEMIILFLYKFKTASQWEQSFNSCRRQGGKRTFAETFLFSSPAVSRSLTWYFSFHYRRYLKLLPCRAPQHCGVFYPAKYRGGDTPLPICNEQRATFKLLPCVLSCKIQGRCPQGRRGQKIPATVVTELNLTSQKSYAPFPPLPIPLTQHRGKE